MMLSIVGGVQEYIQAMIERISGMKVLLLDEDTVGIISMVFSQSHILQSEVFLVDKIDSEATEKMRHMNAICFLRPTNANFLSLAKELKSPRYNQYHLFFTNVVPDMRLENLACCDDFEVVHQVQEFFADVYAINHTLFSLNLPSTIRLTEDHSRWSSYEENVFERTIDGLLATCLALRMLPAIRYTAGSEITRQVAYQLMDRIRQQQSLFETIERDQKGETTSPVLLIVDRRNDPVTPLLNQWTYQAMVHELFTIKNNRVDLSKSPDVRDEFKDIVMSCSQDAFFEENLLSNFGDLGTNVQAYLTDYQKQTKQKGQKLETTEDMQRFVDEYPEFRRMSSNVTKHVTVVHELSRLVQTTDLMRASALEQELACNENRQEHFRNLLEMVSGSTITNMERLRLALLFALRYEQQSHLKEMGQLKDALRSKGIDEDQALLLDQLLRFAGAHVRTGDLFHNKSFFAQAKSAMGKSIKGVDNVYTQHKSQLAGVAEKLTKGKLQENAYPFVEGCRYANPEKRPVTRAIVFIFGGATYEEHRDVSELNRAAEGSSCVVLGGTTIHNSRSFLADVAQL